MYEYRILFPRLGSQQIRRQIGGTRASRRPAPPRRRSTARSASLAGSVPDAARRDRHCPICSGELAVTRLHCRSCGTTLEGDFNVGRFARLSREQFALLESFLRSRGNLKEMERELGISYPTVRARVDLLIRALGLGDGEEPTEEPEPATGAAPAEATAAADAAAARRTVLERLARREIDAATAAAELRALGG